jgi:hypothetical protein
MDTSDQGDAYTEVYAAEVLDRLDDCGCAHCSGCTDAGSCLQHADGVAATPSYMLTNIRAVSTEHHPHLNATRCVCSFKQDVAEADLLGQEVRAPFRAACSQLAAAALAVSAAAPPPEGKDTLEVGCCWHCRCTRPRCMRPAWCNSSRLLPAQNLSSIRAHDLTDVIAYAAQGAASAVQRAAGSDDSAKGGRLDTAMLRLARALDPSSKATQRIEVGSRTFKHDRARTCWSLTSGFVSGL